LDPKRKDCNYPYKGLSGAGIGFKLLQALCIVMEVDQESLYSDLDLVAVSIAADIVPMTGENRILCYHGLKVLNQDPRPGLKSLIELSGRKNIDVAGIVFGIAPRINAAGRIDHANKAVEVLLAETMTEAGELAGVINEKNMERQAFDVATTEEALAMIDAGDNKKATVLYDENWHKGVIGIVASRCIERFHRPTIIFTHSNGSVTGSARSVPGFDIYKAIYACNELLEKFGGHQAAAGLSVSIENLPAFKEKFEAVVAESINDELLIPPLRINTEITFDCITGNFVNIIEQMEPFGPENMAPVFEAKNVRIHNSLQLLKGEHLKFIAIQDNYNITFDAIGFGLGKYYDKVATAEKLSIVFAVEKNEYLGITKIQLNIKDIKI
ncbi:MAG: DHH family phosphoesterase, partial [Cyclobacteriaceae bacterium]|nr:DHH family phosphoesterase [Cyclobacteriaceae bacterium]